MADMNLELGPDTQPVKCGLGSKGTLDVAVKALEIRMVSSDPPHHLPKAPPDASY